MFNIGSLVLFLVASLACLSFSTADNVTYDSNALIINGERRIIFSGSIHYPRSTDAMWPDLIQKAKDGGLDAIETYIFWDRHEPQRRKYDFSGNLDFIKFFQLIQDAGLYVVMRIGPYVCAEWNYGGFPVWLHNMPGIQLRTDNQVYKNEMQTFTTKIVNMCKAANLFASQGGPIIIAQIENEYGNVMTPYGDAGKAYINWCAQMAESLNIGVPWIYLWYMTNVETDQTSSLYNITLHVNTKGHVLHAFVNKRYVGSEWATNGQSFVLEKPISLKSGTNTITLLSATVGLKNYDAFYDTVPTGIDGGPVYLIGSGNATTDLSSNLWSYKVGLNGEIKQLYNPAFSWRGKWRTFDEGCVGRRMTWYKTSFKTPPGVDPVVLDLQGMGKGQGWVNGQSIGRFWPSFIAGNDSCSETCDYRGAYNPSKCLQNCGSPSQRWYHIPRSFLSGDTNSLILFEEIGGNPEQVSVQTVSIQTICGDAEEGSTLELSCEGGHIISEIQFASYGNPGGKCGSFTQGLWNVSNTIVLVEAACIGMESCSIHVSAKSFGIGDATNLSARLAVQALCSNN
ncbi:beta-galactosidase-like [Cucurbita pepo subsp. pepo]|uniref:beta-galactosidase-like n=1 Tax=Cucurbita pepo subsp. pepo TaxID=3664 RepID=UPI000C9D4699|nr:beta-galactosidase-like [Cucurbita pepo subsp. pepo]